MHHKFSKIINEFEVLSKHANQEEMDENEDAEFIDTVLAGPGLCSVKLIDFLEYWYSRISCPFIADG